MKKIYLFCSAGMSTSMLAAKMQDVANSHGVDMEVAAFPHEQISEIVATKQPDCILLGPQVRFQKNTIEKAMEAAGVSKPCDVIDMKDYGMMNGEAVYKKAKAMMGE